MFITTCFLFILCYYLQTAADCVRHCRSSFFYKGRGQKHKVAASLVLDCFLAHCYCIFVCYEKSCSFLILLFSCDGQLRGWTLKKEKVISILYVNINRLQYFVISTIIFGQ